MRMVRLVRWGDDFSLSGRRSLCNAFRDESGKHLLVKTTAVMGPDVEMGDVLEWVVVGWLGRGTTALHCRHHVLTHRLKVLSFFFLCFLAVRDVVARLLCFPFLAFGQDVQFP